MKSSKKHMNGKAAGGNPARNPRMNQWLAALWLLTLVSAIAVVTTRHQNRLAFMAWRQIEADQVELQFERGRLMLEKGTWARSRHLMGEARARLAMAAPAPDNIITLYLEGDR